MYTLDFEKGFMGLARKKHIHLLPLFNNQNYLMPLSIAVHSAGRGHAFLPITIAGGLYWEKYKKSEGVRYLLVNSFNVFTYSCLFVVNDISIIVASTKYIDKIFKQMTQRSHDRGQVLASMQNIDSYKLFLFNSCGGYQNNIIPHEAKNCEKAYFQLLQNAILLS